MNLKDKKVLFTIIGCVIGIIIMMVPSLLTGFSYRNSNSMGGLLTSEFIMRGASYIIGLLVIYDSVKMLNKFTD